MGGSRPKQNDYVFIILVTHPESYRDDGSPRFRWQTVKAEVRTGAIVKNSGFFSLGRARSKTAFSRILGYLRLSCSQPSGKFYPKQWYRWKAEGVHFATVESIWSGRYKIDWRVPKSGHVTITKIENLHIVKKIQWFQKCYSFRSTTKNNEVIAEKPFPNNGVTRRLAVLNWRSSSVHLSMFCIIFIGKKSSETVASERRYYAYFHKTLTVRNIQCHGDYHQVRFDAKCFGSIFRWLQTHLIHCCGWQITSCFRIVSMSNLRSLLYNNECAWMRFLIGGVQKTDASTRPEIKHGMISALTGLY